VRLIFLPARIEVMWLRSSTWMACRRAHWLREGSGLSTPTGHCSHAPSLSLAAAAQLASFECGRD
jgi:hypothetical protein